MKDFKPGDKVTRVSFERLTVVDKEPGSRLSLVRGSDGHYCAVDDYWMYHGHNVAVEVKGEELPERLRLEDVIVPVAEHGAHEHTIKLPSKLAKQLREYFEKEGAR